MSDEKERLHEWKTHTPGLMKEVMLNPGCAILAKPINIFLLTLASAAERASLINDPVLNKLMMQLALYEMADPYSKEYDPDLVSEHMEKYSSFRDDLPEPFKPEEWTSITEGPPKNGQLVAVYMGKPAADGKIYNHWWKHALCMYNHDAFHCGGLYEVTHWKPFKKYEGE